MDIVFEDKDEKPRTNAPSRRLRIVSDRGCFPGSAISSKGTEASITRERIIMAIAMSIVIIWLILTLTTTSWMEPFLFIFVMIVAIVLNMGVETIFGTISFFYLLSTAAILQLAVSMDYSIFLLHTFTALKNRAWKSMRRWWRRSGNPAVRFSPAGRPPLWDLSLSRLCGFTIGKDVGFVLAKGIICAFNGASADAHTDSQV